LPGIAAYIASKFGLRGLPFRGVRSDLARCTASGGRWWCRCGANPVGENVALAGVDRGTTTGESGGRFSGTRCPGKKPRRKNLADRSQNRFMIYTSAAIRELMRSKGCVGALQRGDAQGQRGFRQGLVYVTATGISADLLRNRIFPPPPIFPCNPLTTLVLSPPTPHPLPSYLHPPIPHETSPMFY